MLALTFTILSAICMAIMIITDRIMVGDCYSGKPSHAWVVSSLAGSFFGILLTFFVWLFIAIFNTDVSFADLILTAWKLLIWKGVLMFIIGAIGIQILLHYFRCLDSNSNSAVIAAWLASTPIMIFITLVILQILVTDDRLVHTSIEPLWVVGIILATGGLVLFERVSITIKSKISTTFRKDFILMLALSVIYSILLKQTLAQSETNSDGYIETIALLPFFWIGFAAGSRALLKKKFRHSFMRHWHKRMHLFIFPIFLTEIIGMLVFFFEYLGLSKLDAVYVNIIIGSHIFLVWIFNFALSQLRRKMHTNAIYKISFGPFRILQHKLPSASASVMHTVSEALAIAIGTVGIIIASLYTSL